MPELAREMMSDHSNEKNHDTEIKNVNNILTPQDVQNVARKIFNESSKEVVSFSLNPYSKEKLGFTASHQLLQITVKVSIGIFNNNESNK